jgi:hypothetical protein
MPYSSFLRTPLDLGWNFDSSLYHYITILSLIIVIFQRESVCVSSLQLHVQAHTPSDNQQ